MTLTHIAQIAIILLALLAAGLSKPRGFTRHVGEYFALLLLASLGMVILVGADNLLLIFVALELLSVSVYALAAFDKSSPASAEAALKYFLFGGMAAAFTLFGISLVYGVTGEIRLEAIANALAAKPAEPIFYVGLVMTLCGFAFKLAAAPFHWWAPDVYQGAPTPVAAFIASSSKVASFYVLARILFIAFPGARTDWMSIIAALAVISMLLGNVAALVQTSVKRLLAYSAVAHAGYALLALLADPQHAWPALIFYTITYAVTVLGAFTVVAVAEQNGGANMRDLAGLSRRAPVMSFCMLVFMLSLAGIPPLAGFFGKFYVFIAAASAAPRLGLLWLVIVAVAASAISLYYYLQVLKQIYATAPGEKTAPLAPAYFTQAAIVFMACAVVGLGCFPSLLLTRITAALTAHPF